MPAEPPTPADRPARVSDVIGRTAVDAAGQRLGRVVDVVAERVDRRLVVTGVLVVRGPWGRLLGYEREQVRGPWIIEALARRILRHERTRVPWSELRLE